MVWLVFLKPTNDISKAVYQETISFGISQICLKQNNQVEKKPHPLSSFQIQIFFIRNQVRIHTKCFIVFFVQHVFFSSHFYPFFFLALLRLSRSKPLSTFIHTHTSTQTVCGRLLVHFLIDIAEKSLCKRIHLMIFIRVFITNKNNNKKTHSIRERERKWTWDLVE